MHDWDLIRAYGFRAWIADFRASRLNYETPSMRFETLSSKGCSQVPRCTKGLPRLGTLASGYLRGSGWGYKAAGPASTPAQP